ncbi:hypothetical protein [Streptacidiphilus rugosus]|uniref:hypothetical protein n=1 Tax=Streptacidiphilus rugosus TaxID=405783 RepID=UPI000A4F5440|nr:hypothetical protein [Streptacidiphilus rugosus]
MNGDTPDQRSTAVLRASGRSATALVTTLLGLAAVATALSAAGVRSQPVAALALLFLPAGPGAALAWALPGRDLPLRLLVALFGGLAADTLIAQTMLSLRWWSPRHGALAALLLTAALLAVGALGTRRPDGPDRGRTHQP